MSTGHELALARGKPTVQSMVCAECGRVDNGLGAWTMRLDCDGALHPFCEACDRREFGVTRDA